MTPHECRLMADEMRTQHICEECDVGRKFRPGDRVIVSQDDQVRRAVVVEDTKRPTKARPGRWIDVDSGTGVEGMPSYLLVFDPNPQPLKMEPSP